MGSNAAWQRPRRRPLSARDRWLLVAAVAVLIAAAAAVAVARPYAATVDVTSVGSERPGRPPATTDPVDTAPSGPISVGDFTSEGAATIGAAGGRVETPTATVTVPPGALSAETRFELSTAPIAGTGGVVPLSSMIRIDAGEVYAADVVQVTITADVPDGWFAMGFYRDPASGQLEGMPLLRADASSVTVGARHFSEFFLGGIEEALLPQTLSTGYDPVLDSWQFPNQGTAIAPGGHCAGMSLTAMWFFVEVKPGCGCNLRGQYDNEQAFDVGDDTPDFWYDDARALKWASTVQKDVPWGSAYFDQAWDAMYLAQPNLQLDAFRFAMAVTGEPQFVLLSTPTGTPSHAMVAYGVDGDRLVISDPNTPDTNPDYVTYDAATGKFVPFVSGAKAGGPSITFANIGYAAKSALFEWDRIGTRWAEAEGGSIGMDRFHSYDLMAVELDEDGMEVHEILTGSYEPQRNPLPVYAITLGVTAKVRATFYPGASTTPGPVAEVSVDSTSTIPSSGTYANLDVTGPATFGVMIEQQVQQGVDATGAAIYEWVWADFQRFSIGAVTPTTTLPPTTTPPGTTSYDCSQPRPSDLPGALEWDLHCKGIGS